MKLRFCLFFLFLALVSCKENDEQPEPEFINITLISSGKYELGESISLSAEIESNVTLGKYEFRVINLLGENLLYIEKDNLNEKTISIDEEWTSEQKGSYILNLKVFSQDHALEESEAARIIVL